MVDCFSAFSPIPDTPGAEATSVVGTATEDAAGAARGTETGTAIVTGDDEEVVLASDTGEMTRIALAEEADPGRGTVVEAMVKGESVEVM